MTNFITNTCEFVKGSYEDYKTLKEYHYVWDDPVCLRGIYKVRARQPFTSQFPDPLAVIVYSVPIGEWSARNVALGDFFSQYKTKSLRQTAINHYISYIARLIVDPRFFKLGLGSFLLSKSLELQTHNIVETMTPIDFTKFMFEKAGFKHFYQPTPAPYSRMQMAFHRVGVPMMYWTQPKIVNLRIEALNRYLSDFFHSESKLFLRRFRHHEDMPRGPERIRYILSKINYPNSYLLWHNPKCPSDEFARDF